MSEPLRQMSRAVQPAANAPATAEGKFFRVPRII